MAMNRYGVDARAYWKRWLPQRYAALPDPISFFVNLGEQVEQQVGDLWDALVVNDQAPADETHEQRVGRLGLLKATAEYEVLAELVRLPPEPGAGLEDEDEGLESDAEFETRVQRTREHTEWLARTADALIDGTTAIDALDDSQLHALLNYLTPSWLRVLGTSVEDLRARGRQL
jgi:hypothetical protein